MKSYALLSLALLAALPQDALCKRLFREPRFTRGNTGVFPVQPIDHAAWIAHPDDRSIPPPDHDPQTVLYRCAFTSGVETLVFDVTADERFLLRLDGQPLARGPHRGTVENWTYQTYEIPLAKGEHLLEATVWSLGRSAPLAQITHRPGFCLKAEGPLDATLTTGKAPWSCRKAAGLKSLGKANGAWGVGDQFEIRNEDADAAEAAWTKPAVVRGPMGISGTWGLRQKGWLLFPSQLPDQTEERVRPGRFVSGAEMTFPIVVPAGTTRTILWDLGRYFCAYPDVRVSGGRGGEMTWRWAESLVDEKGLKGDRAAWKGKTFKGFGDRFVFDGSPHADFQPPWFRSGRWCEITVTARDEDVVLEDLALLESRYPLECESLFRAQGADIFADVERLCTRTMQMCAHEMLFDCPYYEQQMYPGDTRVQLNVISAMTSDDRLIRRAIELFALNRRDDGMIPFNFPTTKPQEGAAYTLCYLQMFGDYLMNHQGRDFLRARLPAFRETLNAFELYERADGLLGNLPGWCFLDWVPTWSEGWAPGTRQGGTSAEFNLFYLLALQGAEKVERAFGNEELAARNRRKADALKQAIAAVFFDERRGLFASDEKHTAFSEHAQCLALLADVLPRDKAQGVFERMVAATDLAPVSVYFSYYLFEAYFKFNRADLFLKRLDLWRSYLAKGATTCLESPELPGKEARSDCHAWGAHPLLFFRTGLAGIRSDAPFFARVKIAPQPGPLTSIQATYPHPSGEMIEVDLSFSEGRARGRIKTPVPGVFVFGSQTRELPVGETVISE